MADCSICKHAIMDYAEYFGGLKCWFVDDCEKGLDITEADCLEFDEWEDRDGRNST